ncbi:MAG TPA: Hsp20/alpha crystallin family protein [Candidatus Kapabacteria bacterium]|nr:Hsp20/alpha crystallin family protein [Candidatus Kapabacteria bacterium]
MAYVNFDPFKVVEQFARKMQSVANEVEKGVNVDFGSSFNPRIDINEDDKSVRLYCELAGVKKEDVKITINDENTISIKGIKKRNDTNSNDIEDTQEQSRVYTKMERKFGEFSRSFLMPDNINKGSIEAKFDNGILQITLNKIEAVQAKEVEISVS